MIARGSGIGRRIIDNGIGGGIMGGNEMIGMIGMIGGNGMIGMIGTSFGFTIHPINRLKGTLGTLGN